MATILGGVTLAAPAYGQEGYTKRPIDVGVMHEMADGSVVYDSITTRWAFRLHWNAIALADRVAIETRFLDKTEQEFSPPDSTDTYTVFPAKNGYTDEGYLEDTDGTAWYFCSMELVEVS